MRKRAVKEKQRLVRIWVVWVLYGCACVCVGRVWVRRKDIHIWLPLFYWVVEQIKKIDLDHLLIV